MMMTHSFKKDKKVVFLDVLLIDTLKTLFSSISYENHSNKAYEYLDESPHLVLNSLVFFGHCVVSLRKG